MTILVVEEKPDSSRILRKLLGEVGILAEVAWVADGEEARMHLVRGGGAQVEGRGGLPDLILVELGAEEGEMMGLLIELHAHREWCVIPVAVLCEMGRLAKLQPAYRAGARTFFLKPFHRRDMPAVCALAGARRAQEAPARALV